MSIKRHLTAAFALALALAALTGSALAAPPESPPGQEQAAQTPAGTPGPAQPAQAQQAQQSAPGQEKKAEQAMPPASGKATAPGQAKKTTTPAATKSSQAGGSKATAPSASSRNNAPAQAPSNADWWNAQGKAKNNVPEAASAIPSRVTGDGPGNSGRHKYTICHNGKPITVDVHSATAHVDAHVESLIDSFPSGLVFGSKDAAVCGTDDESTPTVPAVTAVTEAVRQALGTTAAPAAVTGLTPSGAAQSAGGVAGVQETQTSGGGAGGVLGALGVLGQAAGGTLPFTGFPLWLAVVLAIVLVVIGWTLLRRGRPVSTRDVV